jgi:hypothetical protein
VSDAAGSQYNISGSPDEVTNQAFVISNISTILDGFWRDFLLILLTATEVRTAIMTEIKMMMGEPKPEAMWGLVLEAQTEPQVTYQTSHSRPNSEAR